MKQFNVKMHYADAAGRIHKHVFKVTAVPGENIFDTARRDGPKNARKARVARMVRRATAIAA